MTTLFVRGQIGWDLELAFNSLAGMGRNPNIAAVLLVGLEEEVDRGSGAPHSAVGKAGRCDPSAAERDGQRGRRRYAARGAPRGAGLRLQAPTLARFGVGCGVECGGSDTTSG